MTHLKDAGPLRVSDFSVVAQKTLEKLACLWLREVPNDPVMKKPTFTSA